MSPSSFLFHLVHLEECVKLVQLVFGIMQIERISQVIHLLVECSSLIETMRLKHDFRPLFLKHQQSRRVVMPSIPDNPVIELECFAILTLLHIQLA